MKYYKVVTGVLSILVSLFILVQSFFAGVGNILNSSGSLSGTVGVITAITYLSTGIINLIGKSSSTASVVNGVICFLMGLLAIANEATYGDLLVWGYFLFINSIILLSHGISEIVWDKMQKKESDF